MRKDEDIQALEVKLDRLRCDLAATNMVLAAFMGALPSDQRQTVLQSLAQLSAMKAETFDQIPTPAAQAAARQMMEAEDRLYQSLQGLHRMRPAGT